MSEDVTLQGVASLALRLSHRMLVELERRMDAPSKDGDGAGIENKTTAQFNKFGTDLGKQVRALTGMLRESRAQKKDALALFSRLSIAEKRAQCLKFISDMPREHQLEFAADVTAILNGAT